MMLEQKICKRSKRDVAGVCLELLHMLTAKVNNFARDLYLLTHTTR